MNNRGALVKTAEVIGATVLGESSHNLFNSAHQGLGIMLNGWHYPVIIDEEGTAFYDNYNGRWGRSEELERLTDGYAAAMVEITCDQLGWYHERNEVTGSVIVHHPSGGTITVDRGGQLDAQNFSGAGCVDATLPLEQALGRRLDETVKPEMNEVQLTQSQLAEE
jgi:hypothetical protein